MQPSDIIAIIAIVVSVGNVVFQLIWEKHLNTKEKKTALYKEAYKDIFLDELPLAKQKIQYTQYKLTGVNDMEEIMHSIRQKAYVFDFIDKNFKKNVFKLAQEIEDLLVKNEDASMTNEEYRKYYENLECKLKEIYDLVFKKMF